MLWKDLTRSTEVPYWFRLENRWNPNNPFLIYTGIGPMNKTQFVGEIEARFKHYPPKNPEEIRIHEQIREICRETAFQLVNLLPETVLNSREFSMVLTDLENAMMHCNAAYARHKER